MNIIILNKSFGKFKNNKEIIFYYLKVKEDFEELKKIIIEKKPKNIISVDFAIPTSIEINNNIIAIGKESILFNSKPVNWSIPRGNKWIESSKNLNFNISNILESNGLEHFIGSGIQLEYSKNIKKRKRAIKWFHENIKVNFIDNNSAKLLEVISDLNLIDNYAFIRLLHKKTPIYNNQRNYEKIINYFYSIIFYKIISKKILSKIRYTNLILKLSKLN